MALESQWATPFLKNPKMASSEHTSGDDSLYPIAVLIDELRNEDVQVLIPHLSSVFSYKFLFSIVVISADIVMFSPGSKRRKSCIIAHTN